MAEENMKLIKFLDFLDFFWIFGCLKTGLHRRDLDTQKCCHSAMIEPGWRPRAGKRRIGRSRTGIGDITQRSFCGVRTIACFARKLGLASAVVVGCACTCNPQSCTVQNSDLNSR